MIDEHLSLIGTPISFPMPKPGNITEGRAERIEEEEGGEECHEALPSRYDVVTVTMNTPLLWTLAKDWTLPHSILERGGNHKTPAFPEESMIVNGCCKGTCHFLKGYCH